MANAGKLKAALYKYHPAKYVIIESRLSYSRNLDIFKALKNIENFEKPNNVIKTSQRMSKARELYNAVIKHNPYERLLRYQYKMFKMYKEHRVAAITEFSGINDKILLNKLLQKMNEVAKEYGIKIIVVCHSRAIIRNDGNVSYSANDAALKEYGHLCEENGIYFLNMCERFKEEYENTYTLPYGFINTSVNTGHLNKYGHDMTADELYKLIQSIEIDV